jgi:hypothetical protein
VEGKISLTPHFFPNLISNIQVTSGKDDIKATLKG